MAAIVPSRVATIPPMMRYFPTQNPVVIQVCPPWSGCSTQPCKWSGPEACGTVEPTYVISTSYTYDEAQFTPFYTERQCTEFAKFGLMGITLLYSSGDNGVAGSNQTCLSPNGKNCDLL